MKVAAGANDSDHVATFPFRRIPLFMNALEASRSYRHRRCGTRQRKKLDKRCGGHGYLMPKMPSLRCWLINYQVCWNSSPLQIIAVL